MIKELDNIKLTAIQFTGDNFDEVKDFVGNYYYTYSCYSPPVMGFPEVSKMHISILEKGRAYSYRELEDGDWIVKMQNTITGKDPIFIIISDDVASGGYLGGYSDDSNN